MDNYFTDQEFKNFPARPKPIQAYLKDYLKMTLNLIRAYIDSPIRITGCYRTMNKYHALIKAGYFPSVTSDHFWGQVIATIREKDRKKYGSYFIFSAGAVDFITPKYSIEKCFDMIRELYKKGTIKIGQAILEYGKRSPWIHLSNPRQLIFQNDLLERVGAIKSTFLISKDGGKSYQHI